MSEIRIATYNIRALRDDGRAVVRVLRALDADVVCIQEAPRFLFWRIRCRRLATAAGLTVIAGGRAARANILMARPGVVVHRTRSVKFSTDRSLSLRGATLADVTIRGLRLTIVGTHLDGVDAPRLRHIDELHHIMDGFIQPEVPYVVGVDVNAEPGTSSWDLLTADALDAAAVTSTGDPMTNQPLTPARRIDALFVSPLLQVLDTQAIDSPAVNAASDHRPVLATLSPIT